MRRVMMGAAMAAAACGLAMSAAGSIRPFASVKPEFYGPRFGARGTSDGIGFEAAEGYVQGNITGQNGWFTSNPPNGTEEVRNGLNSGNGSANALRLSKGTQAQGAFGVAQAPLSLNSRTMTVDARIDDSGGANYFVRGLIAGASGAVLAFRVEFDFGGHIFLQSPADGSFADTGVPWVPNQYNTVTVNITPSVISYQYGATPLGTTPVSAAGAFFDVVQFAHDNYQDTGAGPFSTAGDPAAGYFDNLLAIPTPGAAIVLGMGGLVIGRRRRA